MPLAGPDAFVSGRYIYVLGGLSGREHLGQRGVWVTKVGKSGDLGKWKKTKPLPVPMGFVVATQARGRIYLAGGSGRVGMQHVYDKVYSAEIRKRGRLSGWREERSLPAKLVHHAATFLNGNIYVLGGFDGQKYRQTVHYARVNSDGTLGEWMTGEALYPHPVGRTFMSSIGSDLMVVGGLWYDSQGEHVTSLIMRGRLAPDGNVTEWTGEKGVKIASGSLRYSLAEHAGVKGENFVYVLGGSGPDSPGVPTTQASWMHPEKGWITEWQFGPKLPRFDVLGAPQDARVFQGAAAIVGDFIYMLGGYLFVREPTASVWKQKLAEYEEPSWLKAKRAKER